jgi:predicted RNase H-like HicB family nuclease
MDSSTLKYEVIIFWSDEDNVYVADAPELPGCMAHGFSYDEALQNIRDAMSLWIDTAKEFGNPVPEPKGHRLVFA